ncbi:MAG: Serine/threonine protein kinase [Planctomycetaceae bacterium]|nr:Serine/threonine protein kinase [Planctomycetaceae bacterium]
MKRGSNRILSFVEQGFREKFARFRPLAGILTNSATKEYMRLTSPDNSPRFRELTMTLFRFVACSLLICLLPGCGKPSVAPTPEVSATGSPAAGAKVKLGPNDWHQWRGPDRDGIAKGPVVPASWSDGDKPENIVWKAQIPGRGHSCPIIVGERIYLETADEKEQTQSVLCLNRTDGTQIWKTDVFKGKLEKAVHAENTQATSTLVCDGEQLYATFLNDRLVWCVALNLKGEPVWQREVGGFASKFGFSPSPELYQSLVIIAADHQSGGFIAAMQRSSGEIVWRKSRPAFSSYASSRVIKLGGKDQLVLCGCDLVAGFDPNTGEQLWSTKGTTEATVGTLVTDGDLVFASGGFPGSETLALKPDGNVAWRDKEKSYVPSLLIHDGYLYMVNDSGIAYCYAAKTGTSQWKKRIGGNFRVSPVLSGDNIITTDMQGKTTVFKANPKEFELVAENQLGTEAFSSPAISNGQLFQRVADNSSGSRQEWLYCIGKPEEN